MMGGNRSFEKGTVSDRLNSVPWNLCCSIKIEDLFKKLLCSKPALDCIYINNCVCVYRLSSINT